MSYVCLSLKYDAYSEIKVPAKHAEKLQSGEWSYFIKWGEMTYVDDAGQEHVLQATDPEVMCKFPLDEKWPDHDIEEQIRLLTIENKRRAKEYIAEKEKAKKEAYMASSEQPNLTVSEIKMPDNDSEEYALQNKKE
jgi:hypothetical protein